MFFKPSIKSVGGMRSIPERLVFAKMPASIPNTIKQMHELRPLASAGGLMTEQGSFHTYALKLDVLNKLGVLTENRTVLYPLMGADLLPAQYSRLVGIDREVGANVGSTGALAEFVADIKHNLRIDLPDMSLQPGTTNIRYDLLKG